MSHKHSCSCEHTDVKYCKHCGIVYCRDCNNEWPPHRSGYWYNGYPWTTYTGTAQLATSFIQSTTASNGPYNTFCEHS